MAIVKKEKTVLTKEDLVNRFPQKKNTITDEVVDLINAANSDPEFNGNEFIDTMVTYRNVMLKNSASIKEYITAVKFVAFLESTEDNYTQAYIRARSGDTFVQERLNLPTDSSGYKELTNAASRYRKSPLVIDLLTQTDMPLRLMFRGARYQAVNVLVTEMHEAVYSKDRIAAAKAVLENLKEPENMAIELDVGIKQDSIIDRYEEMIDQLVKTQMQQISDGGNLKEITNIAIVKTNDIIDVEAE